MNDKNDNGKCDQICVNEIGSYHCDCRTGYKNDFCEIIVISACTCFIQYTYNFNNIEAKTCIHVILQCIYVLYI